VQPSTRGLKTGNFTERTDFTEAKLAPYWTFIRTIREPWFDLTSKPGWLTINARPADIGKRTQPSFIGRRQQHAYATVSTALQFTPLADGDKAGLAAFQGDDNYYLLVITRAAGKRVVQLEQSMGRGATRVLASAPLAAASEASVQLKIVARGDRYDFAYALTPTKWLTLKNDVDGTFLSTKVAGGFVGTMLGMYAVSRSQ
jgi:alpha-N-arabinofuranosidase